MLVNNIEKDDVKKKANHGWKTRNGAGAEKVLPDRDKIENEISILHRMELRIRILYFMVINY